MLFGIGALEDVLESDAPYLFLFLNTGSHRVALLLIVILFLLIFTGNITTLVTVSRELWAFSRDRGFPFSGWISHVYIPSFFTSRFLQPHYYYNTLNHVERHKC